MNEEKVYTVEEVAERFRITPNTVTRAIKQKKLAATRPGKQYRITEKAVEEWVRIKETKEDG